MGRLEDTGGAGKEAAAGGCGWPPKSRLPLGRARLREEGGRGGSWGGGPAGAGERDQGCEGALPLGPERQARWEPAPHPVRQHPPLLRARVPGWGSLRCRRGAHLGMCWREMNSRTLGEAQEKQGGRIHLGRGGTAFPSYSECSLG